MTATRNTNGTTIKNELKKAFPSVKFSVRMQDYSTFYISWTNGPACKEVDSVVAKFEMGDFNGMTDCYEYTNKAGFAKYIFTTRQVSEELESKITEQIKSRYCDKAVEHEERAFYNDANLDMEDFLQWDARKKKEDAESLEAYKLERAKEEAERAAAEAKAQAEKEAMYKAENYSEKDIQEYETGNLKVPFLKYKKEVQVLSIWPTGNKRCNLGDYFEQLTDELFPRVAIVAGEFNLTERQFKVFERSLMVDNVLPKLKEFSGQGLSVADPKAEYFDGLDGSFWNWSKEDQEYIQSNALDICVAVKCGTQTILVNGHGKSYARYVGFLA
jgi:hypothetical protein